MQVLEEESQLNFSANELGSVRTMLQLLIVLFEAFATKQTYLHISQRLWNLSVVYIFPIAFNALVQLMIFFYQMKIQMKICF